MTLHDIMTMIDQKEMQDVMRHLNTLNINSHALWNHCYLDAGD